LYLGSDFRTPFDLKVRDLLEMGLLVGHDGWWPDLATAELHAVVKMAEKFGIQSWLNRTFRTLSDGEKQWVMLARAILQKSKITIFDESFSKLDLDHLVTAIQILREYADKGGTLIICSHDLNFLSELSDELLVLKSGGVVKRGSPNEVLRADCLRELYPELDLVITQNEKTGRSKVIY
jgi:iron complex transport system ATP-binding protein